MIVPRWMANDPEVRAMLPSDTVVMVHVGGPTVTLERWLCMTVAERAALDRPLFRFMLEPRKP